MGRVKIKMLNNIQHKVQQTLTGKAELRYVKFDLKGFADIGQMKTIPLFIKNMFFNFIINSADYLNNLLYMSLRVEI